MHYLVYTNIISSTHNVHQPKYNMYASNSLPWSDTIKCHAKR